MTELLKRAFEEAAKLPPEEQDAFAARVLAELESDRQWDQAFARSSQLLKTLADEALADFRGGRTDPIDPDRL